ncbi:hypothetical protein CNMCM5793_005005 [Aspergillus hiratsukae]|uniref:Uncharacterized protein n=1 Tax=Aspergillus hiratsukae TaxID=1194566 RepID=A0A8H6PFP5_9EURO|nr:hypothetical protein CNMCM5793_005005 [Aspergillus hiratsukae]KAF7173447.1 hypothetical protein CNMCM6106_007543 [Aspergillus hiratsukae]
MPSKPVASPPLQPKKVHGTTRDDEPIDDYENAIRSKQQEEQDSHQASDTGNIAAARRVDAPGGPHERHIGNTGSRNRSTSGH